MKMRSNEKKTTFMTFLWSNFITFNTCNLLFIINGLALWHNDTLSHSFTDWITQSLYVTLMLIIIISYHIILHYLVWQTFYTCSKLYLESWKCNRADNTTDVEMPMNRVKSQYSQNIKSSTTNMNIIQRIPFGLNI